jgi:hypothetical protein
LFSGSTHEENSSTPNDKVLEGRKEGRNEWCLSERPYSESKTLTAVEPVIPHTPKSLLDKEKYALRSSWEINSGPSGITYKHILAKMY